MVRARQESMVKSVERKLTSRKKVNKGAWTAEEDRKLAEALAIHGATKWQRIASKSELNRSGKSCRLRWLNYLRPNIKRGNISDQEEDLILRLHKLIGNRWSLIAGRLPGRTDNEIKNYWNSHLSKKVKQMTMNHISGVVSITRDQDTSKAAQDIIHMKVVKEDDNLVKTSATDQDSNNSSCFDMDDFFDFSNEGPFNLEWITNFV